MPQFRHQHVATNPGRDSTLIQHAWYGSAGSGPSHHESMLQGCMAGLQTSSIHRCQAGRSVLRSAASTCTGRLSPSTLHCADQFPLAQQPATSFHGKVHASLNRNG